MSKSFEDSIQTEREKNENKDNLTSDEERFQFLESKEQEKILLALQTGQIKKKELIKMVEDLLVELNGKNEIIFNDKMYLDSMLKEKEKLLEMITKKDKVISTKNTEIDYFKAKENFNKEQLQDRNQENIKTKQSIGEKENDSQDNKNKLDEKKRIIRDTQAACNSLTNKKKREAVNIGENFTSRLDFEAVTRENEYLHKQLQAQTKQLEEKQEQLDRFLKEEENSREEKKIKQLTINRLTEDKERLESEKRNKELVILEMNATRRLIKEENTNLEEQLLKKDSLLREKGKHIEQLELFRRDLTEQIQRLESVLQLDKQTREREMTKVLEEKRSYEQSVTNLEENLKREQRIRINLESDFSRARQSLNIYRQNKPWLIEKEEIELSETILGTGAWGRVLEGNFRGIPVAVKEIHEVISSEHNRSLFDREITFATLVRHPCLLQFMGVASYGTENPLLITELMDMSLSELLSRERVTAIKYTMIIALDIARGINYLHLFRPTPIIHRDINPGNVMVWRQGDRWRAKVCDFGSAEFQGRNMSVNPGNPFYSAPEASKAIQTPKIDVFSFGVLLCEMCTKEPPDPDKRDLQISSVWNKNIRASLTQFMDKSPDKRPTMDSIIRIIQPMT